MSSRGFHYIAVDLEVDLEGAIEVWAALGLEEIKELLAKHAAFHDQYGED